MTEVASITLMPASGKFAILCSLNVSYFSSLDLRIVYSMVTSAITKDTVSSAETVDTATLAVTNSCATS